MYTCVLVCVSVTNIVAASFISTLEIRYEQVYHGTLFILTAVVFMIHSEVRRHGVICLL